MLDASEPAPDFTLPRDGGGTVTLSDLRDTGVDGTGFTMSHIAARQELRELLSAVGI